MGLSIEVENVSRHFGGVRAVDDVSFQVEDGAIAGLIGPNGAGKTTMFNAITGVLPPSRGTVLLGGHDVTKLSLVDCSALGVARTFQTPRCFTSLTVRENVEVMLRDPRESLVGALFGRGSKVANRALVVETLERVGLAHLADATTDMLSGGELRMLEIARQLVRSPKLLMLDEPTAGLDRDHQAQLSRILAGLNAEGTTILLVEHNLRFLFANVQKVLVMSAGRLIASGDPSTVSNDEAVINAYLGRVEDETFST
ncbi:MAG: ABC transporter ATP-binding protein [Actinomycetota bacterium]|nr:ABC transporter ATP-binding protein [Actinomycetota bacterium]